MWAVRDRGTERRYFDTLAIDFVDDPALMSRLMLLELHPHHCRLD
jgi:hypothetical protein